MGAAPLLAEVRTFEVDAERLRARRPARDGGDGGMQLDLWQRPWRPDDADQERRDPGFRHPARIAYDLRGVGGMQIEAASTMGVHVHEPRHHGHALSVDNAARLGGDSPDLLDTLRREREVACRKIECGINQPGAAQGASHGHLFANSLPGHCQLTLG